MIPDILNLQMKDKPSNLKLNSEKERKYLMREWYLNLEIQHKIIQSTQQRETAFLLSSAEKNQTKAVNLRYVSMNKTMDLSYQIQQTFKIYDNEPRLYNIYYSIAHFKRFFPYFKFGKERRQSIEKWTKHIMCKTIDYVDLFIDIDTNKDSFKAGKETTKKLMDFFDKYNITYQVRMSGKGFHIVCDGRQFIPLNLNITEDLDDDKSIMNVYYKIAEYLHKEYSELIDLAVYDLRRVTKANYSLVHYMEELKIVLPFQNHEEFLECDYNTNNIKNVMTLLDDDLKNINKRKNFKYNVNKESKVRELIEKCL
ncbi:MAG: hypothetical protein ACQERX_02080 [Bacillota bacterium]